MRKEQSYTWKNLSLGTCYYPEQWDKSLWQDDLQRMKENGIFTIRIAEFAWSKIEPREGCFTFSFFDEFLNLAEKEGMKVIFGTPTATPPAWLTEKYPEVLNSRKDGVLFRHGMRRHVNYNSAKYYELSAIIIKKIAEHYGKHPCIIGWQLDNEINCEINEYYSESDTIAFRKFLKNKYHTLENLNEAWGTVFWNQTYTEWEELYVPRTTINGFVNPHQMLDYYRFVSESVSNYFKMQSEIIQTYKKPNDFITTNGMFANLDNHRVMDESLDVYTYDSYPNFAFSIGTNPRHSEDLNDRGKSYLLSEVRSICPHFGIMEQQSGANGWTSSFPAPAPKPGQMMLWTMQSIAHGADYISFFRWRTALKGTEMYWHGILDYNNKDNRKIKELREIWKRIKKINEIAGADYKASFAILRDYDNIWDSQLDIWHNRLTDKSEKEIFVASQLWHTPMDVVYLLEKTDVSELEKYPVLIYPHPLILTEQQAKILKTYVKNGGCLIIGARTGLKDSTGACVMTSTPGLLSDATETETCDFTMIGPADDAVDMVWEKDSYPTGLFNEMIQTTGNAKVLAVYESSYYKGKPALTETPYGKGKLIHFGGTFTRKTIKKLLEYTNILEPERAVLELPEACELAVREKNGQRYYFVLNYKDQSQIIRVKQPLIDMDTKETIKCDILLKEYETKVLKIATL